MKEYKVCIIKALPREAGKLEQKCNEMATNGWELEHCTVDDCDYTLFFVRDVSEVSLTYIKVEDE